MIRPHDMSEVDWMTEEQKDALVADARNCASGPQCEMVDWEVCDSGPTVTVRLTLSTVYYPEHIADLLGMPKAEVEEKMGHAD